MKIIPSFKHRIRKIEEKLAPRKRQTMLVADAGDLDDMNNPTPQLRTRIKRVCMNRNWNLTNCEFLIINTGLYRYTNITKHARNSCHFIGIPDGIL